MANTAIRLGYIAVSSGGGGGGSLEEYSSLATFPPLGQTGIIYLALNTAKLYRWTGITYAEISPSEVVSVNTKTGVVVLAKADIGLGNVDNTSDLNKPISTATQTALNAKYDASNPAGYVTAAEAAAAAPVQSVNTQVGDVVLDKNDIGLSNVDNTSDLDKPISNDTQDALDALDLRIDPIEDRSLVKTVYAYENNALVYADGQPGVKDPSALIRDGWYFKNTVAGQKINWYYFDGTTQGTLTLGDFKSAYAIMTFDAVSGGAAPIIAIYTVPTGTGDVIPGFAHSRLVYDGPMTPTPVVGQQYVVYAGENPPVNPELPRINLTFIPGLSIGDKLPTEQILTISFGSQSGASVNQVQYMVETLGLFSTPVKHELDLRIRTVPLNTSNKIDATYLPSYVDDVEEYANLAAFPSTGETGKIYVALDTNKIYRWSGSAYIEISPSPAPTWGSITGTLSLQTDLQSALDGKANTSHTQDLSTINQSGATTGQVPIWNGTAWAPGVPAGTATWGGITGTLALQTDLQSALDGKFDDPTGTTAQYIRGDGSLATFPTSTNQANSLVTTVFNKSGAPIPKFSVVYINGGQGDLPTIALAQANNEAGSSKTYGVVYADIPNMQSGQVIVTGALTGLNTDQFNPTAPTGNVNGVALYLSPTVPGGVTTTKPSAPNHMVYVATIVRTHQNEGVVEVRIQNGFELGELHNVQIPNGSAQNNQVLKYDSATSLWKNKYIGLASDIEETSFSIANNQAAPTNITGLAFSNAVVRSFSTIVSVSIDATADLFEVFEIKGVQKGSEWDFSVSSTGDNTGISFSITNAGQIQYTSASYVGFVSGTMKFRASTTSV